MAMQVSVDVLKIGKIKPVEHITVPQVLYNPVAFIGPAPQTYNKSVACSVCTVDLYAVQRNLLNIIISTIMCQYLLHNYELNYLLI